MVQMPVFPLHSSHANLVHWTYADEFAEYHTKDLMVRQHFSGFVPSAGVGTAFNRWLVEFVGTSYAKNIFRSKSLTEDYDLALRLALGKANLLFTYKPFGINVATRGYFPHTMKTSIRQKSRWITGICLQSWKNVGWKGDARFKFVLYRDRKAVIANAINFAAYVVILYLICYEAIRFGFEAYRQLPPIVVKGTLLWDLVVIDSIFMIWRMAHRFITVRRIYGVWAGTLSMVRLPVSNIINFSATGRALWMFMKSIIKKKELKWEKTAHQFPGSQVAH
jgi:adsorption protein B